MISGEFDASGVPLVSASLWLPGQDVEAEIGLAVDTGADVTLIQPSARPLLGLDYSRLSRRLLARGIGGFTDLFVEPAVLTFRGATALYVYRVSIVIALPTPDNRDAPSLLGRDILNNWHMDYDPVNDRLAFEVRRADDTVEVPAR